MKRAVVAAAFMLVAFAAVAQDLPNGKMGKLPGMDLPGMITREDNGIPHVFALTTHDAWFLNGWLHAQDRLFQMDTNRRIASGTLGELLGTDALSTDVQLRTFGLRRAAEAALPLLSAPARAALDAYTAGVNAYITSHPALPPEYGLLEITQIPQWSNVDSLAVGKLIAFGLSFDSDIDATIALISYQTAGKIVGFDGNALFADTWRTAPFTKAATIPDATGAGSPEPLSTAPHYDMEWLKPETVSMMRDYGQQIREVPLLASALDPEKHAGSNEWAIAGKNSTTGNALIANDPHLSLVSPPNFYPISVRVPGRLNVAGMGFPGAPFVIQGQNERIAWGSTVHPMDVTDWYQEQLAPAPQNVVPSGFVSLYKGQAEPVQVIPQTYRVNKVGDGVKDNLSVVTPSALVPNVTLIVPRHGPVVQADTKTGIAITVQYVGFYPTHELEAFMLIDQARNVDEFKAALQFFDFGSQNFAYADVDGTIAYFTSGELPIREDLQAGTVTGAPPYFIRNGQGGNEWMAVKNPQPNQALPFEILPYSEMPQVVNPSNGWFVNANNDPTGQTLDNNPLNTPRPGGGILYLNPGYDGFRAGRITQLVRQKLVNSGKISPDDMKAIQADTVLVDAEVFVPFITAALNNAKSSTDPALGALAAAPGVADAVARLGKWDFSTPTGIPEGYDASDVNGALSTPAQAEIDNSVAATIYSAWRSRFMANTLDAVLTAMTVPLPPSQQELSSLRFQLENFAATGGKGFSGVNFFNGPSTDAAARRDAVILKSLVDALAMLSSDAFAPAFNKSTNLGDYRWGKLHRVVFSHLMGGALFSPGAAFGLPPLPSVVGLTGVSVDGGFSTVDAATHNARASSLNGFMFSGGPNRRFVGDMSKDGVRGQSALPGGVSGIQTSPWFTNLLMLWLTNDTFAVTPDRTPAIPFLP
ncbi:MAG TPA: penicillin acylase family protein [Thermoanaerobaculia bacterium]|nr:penicillin acylase family protein [Thermoanaerobaculia bacterium]